MNNYAISAKNVSKKFRLYHEKRDSIFEAATSFFQKKKKYDGYKINTIIQLNLFIQ